MINIQSFLIIFKRVPRPGITILDPDAFEGMEDISKNVAWGDRVEMLYRLRKEWGHRRKTHRPASRMQMVWGDGSKPTDSEDEPCLANSVLIDCDPRFGRIRVVGSIVGLPPVYIGNFPSFTAITSSLHHLTAVPGVSLNFEPRSIRDLGLIGHPIGHRTLFKEVSILPAGTAITVGPSQKVEIRKVWEYPDPAPFARCEQYRDLQVETFLKSVHRIDLSDSLLSLTGGLDTRALLAALIKGQKTVNACTMSGRNDSLDVRNARDLCRHYGIRHTIIRLDEDFIRGLPELSLEASRLSGGIASIDQAHEVYFSRQIARSARARLSGNLGNHVGRLGTEKISMRNTNLDILNPEIAGLDRNERPEHWFSAASTSGGELSMAFLIQNEYMFSSLANYSIGNHFIAQPTPYADRVLIENTRHRPRAIRTQSFSLLRLRVKDLRHRFLGEPPNQSFQVKLIRDVAGYVATCPINWGWRAGGGVSASGLLRGCMALLDAAFSSRTSDSSMVYGFLNDLGISGLHDYRRTDMWLKRHLRGFIHDAIFSRSGRGAPLFYRKRLETTLREYERGVTSHRKEIGYVLDLSLARQIFNAGL